LHQCTQFIHQISLCLPDRASPIALATHQPSPLQLTELPADVRLRKAGGLDQAGHIDRALLEMAEQLQPGRLAQDPEELAVFLKQLRRRHGLRGSHGNHL